MNHDKCRTQGTQSIRMEKARKERNPELRRTMTSEGDEHVQGARTDQKSLNLRKEVITPSFE